MCHFFYNTLCIVNIYIYYPSISTLSNTALYKQAKYSVFGHLVCFDYYCTDTDRTGSTEHSKFYSLSQL